MYIFMVVMYFNFAVRPRKSAVGCLAGGRLFPHHTYEGGVVPPPGPRGVGGARDRPRPHLQEAEPPPDRPRQRQSLQGGAQTCLPLHRLDPTHLSGQRPRLRWGSSLP